MQYAFKILTMLIYPTGGIRDERGEINIPSLFVDGNHGVSDFWIIKLK